MEDIMKIVKSREESGIQKLQFLPMSFGTLAASMLGSTLKGSGVIRVGAGTIRPGKNF